MEEIKHTTVSVNGIKMHVAEKGEGPVVLFLHGFPELWYSWRHQILALSSLGYHAVAPDLRGFGDTEAPGSISSYTIFHIVGDTIALIDFLGVEQVYLVGHDWGAIIAWHFCLFRPDKVKALVCLSVPFRPRNPNVKPVEELRAAFGHNYYVCAFQEPGRGEALFARIGAAEVVKGLLKKCKPGSGVPCVPEEDSMIHCNIANHKTLPSWFLEDDLKYFVTKYEQTGFTAGLNYYRNLDLDWELMAPWNGVKVEVPTKFLIGELDTVYVTPGVKEYIHDGRFKQTVPLLEEIVVIEDAGHCINQEKAEEISTHIYDFIKKF